MQATIASDCIAKANLTAPALKKLFDFNQYDGFTSIINFLNITMIKVMDQFNHCGMNEYLAKLDNTFSNIPEAAGMGANLVTQVVEFYAGSKDFKPAVVVAMQEMIN